MLKSCVMYRYRGSAPGIMVWGGIGYHSRTPLVHIAGILNSQRYITEVLEPVVLPYLQGLATAIFQQDNKIKKRKIKEDSAEDFVFPEKTARPVSPSVSEPVATKTTVSQILNLRRLKIKT
ncbi:transposable element Tcb1 transposase [Trichonephila clavipes]|nr:transposable element Tcb1 transposase [Trichonephila clavipes]